MKRKIQESVAAIRARTEFRPEVGIILGTGLTALLDKVRADSVVSYHEVPHFPEPTVETHHGRFVLGWLENKAVMVMQGRFHFYEGYDLKQITHPVRVMKELGVTTLVLTNAAGGLNPLFRPGDIVLITDHINLTGRSPLIGPNDDTLGPRFPHMHRCYDPELAGLAAKVALSLAIPLQRGVYAWVTGPNLETGAEYRYLRAVGADMVGMSTVPEVIVARHAGLRVLGFSVVTDMGLPDALEAVSLEDVLDVAREAEPKLTTLVVETLKRL